MPVGRVFSKEKIVQLPGETVYIDVPGETVYVDVPGETVYVDVPGPTIYVDSSLLAEFDLSVVPDVDLKTNGDYTIPVTGGSTSATTAILKVMKAENVGATGVQRILNGKLELMPSTITSELGLQYWSALPASMLGIDIRTLSTKLQADTYFQQLEYEVHLEIEPLYFNGVISRYQPAYTYMYGGFLHNLDLWDSAGTPRPQGCTSGYRSLMSPTSLSRNVEMGGISFGPSSILNTTDPLSQTQNAPAPFNTLYNNSPTRISTIWNGLAGFSTHSNGTASLTRSPTMGNIATYANHTLPSTFTAGRTTNNLWATIYASRSTGSISVGDVPFRIKKIKIFERSL